MLLLLAPPNYRHDAAKSEGIELKIFLYIHKVFRSYKLKENRNGPNKLNNILNYLQLDQ